MKSVCYIIIFSELPYEWEPSAKKQGHLGRTKLQSQTVRGKLQDHGARNTKLVDIPSPDLSLNVNSNSLSRSITVTSSQSGKVFAEPKAKSYSSPNAQARIDASEPSFENKDRSAVVRAVVSVSDSDGKLIRKGTVTDITNE